MEPNQFGSTLRSQSTTHMDVGLRKHMNNIYTRMSMGVLVTAIVALIVGSSPLLLNLFLGGPHDDDGLAFHGRNTL